MHHKLHRRDTKPGCCWCWVHQDLPGGFSAFTARHPLWSVCWQNPANCFSRRQNLGSLHSWCQPLSHSLYCILDETQENDSQRGIHSCQITSLLHSSKRWILQTAHWLREGTVWRQNYCKHSGVPNRSHTWCLWRADQTHGVATIEEMKAPMTRIQRVNLKEKVWTLYCFCFLVFIHMYTVYWNKGVCLKSCIWVYNLQKDHAVIDNLEWGNPLANCCIN